MLDVIDSQGVRWSEGDEVLWTGCKGKKGRIMDFCSADLALVKVQGQKAEWISTKDLMHYTTGD